MNHLVIGMGQIGSAVAQVLSDNRYDISTLDKNSEPINRQMDVLHICIPYSSNFTKIVKKYQRTYKPKLTIIYSSVPVGTTRKIENAVHSPVEGRHPRLYRSIKVGKRFIGYNSERNALQTKTIWGPITSCQLIENSDYTEFLKLASTSKFGINVVWAEYMAQTTKELGMSYNLVKDWDKAYNQLYKNLKFPQFRKYVLDPPEGKIGGHCIVPNAELLDEQFPHDMLKMIKEFK